MQRLLDDGDETLVGRVRDVTPTIYSHLIPTVTMLEQLDFSDVRETAISLEQAKALYGEAWEVGGKVYVKK
jgi:hypothetical protein